MINSFHYFFLTVRFPMSNILEILGNLADSFHG